ncbi:MAG: hypothetical protein EXS01_03590 [Phycisphaerales bacterium]|nr:hypothetical protein [Phycisphaerales bacterium]
MPLVIDVNNLLHVTGVLPAEIAGPDESELAHLIAQSRFQGDAVCFVCDGAPRGRPTSDIGSIVFHYSGTQTSADAVIAKMVDDCTAPRRLTVVSSDRAILKQAKRRRCPTLTSDEFLEILSRDYAKQVRGTRKGAARSAGLDRTNLDPLTQLQIEAWKKYFGLDDPKNVEALRTAAREGPAHRKPHDRRTPRRL